MNGFHVDATDLVLFAVFTEPLPLSVAFGVFVMFASWLYMIISIIIHDHIVFVNICKLGTCCTLAESYFTLPTWIAALLKL